MITVEALRKPRRKKARLVRSNINVLLTIFFDYSGMVHHEFLLQGRMVNKEYYLEYYLEVQHFVRKAQNCGKTNHGFCPLLTHQCLCVNL